MATGTNKMKLHLYPDWGPRVLRRQPPDGQYERYARLIGAELRDAAIMIFFLHQRKDNDNRVSELTPPHYISSFRVDYHRASFKILVQNTDPGWALVEWGARPGGNDTFVLRYKPMTRALIVVSNRRL